MADAALAEAADQENLEDLKCALSEHGSAASTAALVAARRAHDKLASRAKKLEKKAKKKAAEAKERDEEEALAEAMRQAAEERDALAMEQAAREAAASEAAARRRAAKGGASGTRSAASPSSPAERAKGSQQSKPPRGGGGGGAGGAAPSSCGGSPSSIISSEAAARRASSATAHGEPLSAAQERAARELIAQSKVRSPMVAEIARALVLDRAGPFLAIGRTHGFRDAAVAHEWLAEVDVENDPRSEWSANAWAAEGVPGLVVALMDAHAGHAGVQECGCAALYSLSRSHDDVDISNERRQSVVDAYALRAIARAMRAFPTSAVGQAACRAVYNVCGGEMDRRQSPRGNEARAAAAAEGLIELVISFLQRHTRGAKEGHMNAEVGLRALHNLCCLATEGRGHAPRHERLSALERAMWASEGGALAALGVVAESELFGCVHIKLRHQLAMDAIMSGMAIAMSAPDLCHEAGRRQQWRQQRAKIDNSHVAGRPPSEACSEAARCPQRAAKVDSHVATPPPSKACIEVTYSY